MRNTGKTIISLFILSLVMNYQSSTALSPHIGFSIGDSFEFKFSQFEIYRAINETMVIKEDGNNLINYIIEMTINDIQESNDGFFKELYGESTYVNVTDTFKSGTFNTIVPLDYWFYYYYQMEIMFDYLITFFDPELGLSGEIEYLDTNDFSNYAALPVLATTNITFYQALEEEIPDYSGTPPMPPDRTTSNQDELPKFTSRLTQASLEDHNFKMNVTNGDLRSGETTSNETWSIGGLSNFYTEVNIEQGVVDKISWSFIYHVAIGLETDDFVYEVEIINLNPGVTTKLQIELYQGLTLALFGLIILKLQRKKI